MNPVRVLTILFPALVVAGCTSNQEEFTDRVEVEVADGEALLSVPGNQTDGPAEGIEWIVCRPEKGESRGHVLLVGSWEMPVGGKEFCAGWLAGVFQAEGYAVVGVNPPEVGRSPGRSDLGGGGDRRAILDGLAEAGKAAGLQGNPAGLWGYGVGTITAGFLSKGWDGKTWLIAGAGIYDAEIVSKQTKDRHLAERIARLLAGKGDVVLEDRSIAWDFSGLSKRVIIYHGERDTLIPWSQAASFRDNLATQEFQADFLLLPGTGHKLKPRFHQQTLKKILQEKLAAPASPPKT